MCGLHAEPGANKRKPGSGGKFRADGITPRVVSRMDADDKAAAKKAAQKKYKEATVGTRVDKDVMAIWTGFDKPEGELNRWLNKLAREAKVAGAATGCSSTGTEMAAEEVDAEKLKRHKPRDTKNPRINCKSPPSLHIMSWLSCARCAGWRKECCRAVVGMVVGGWCGGMLVTGSGSSSSTQLDTTFSLITLNLYIEYILFILVLIYEFILLRTLLVHLSTIHTLYRLKCTTCSTHMGYMYVICMCYDYITTI